MIERCVYGWFVYIEGGFGKLGYCGLYVERRVGVERWVCLVILKSKRCFGKRDC